MWGITISLLSPVGQYSRKIRILKCKLRILNSYAVLICCFYRPCLHKYNRLSNRLPQNLYSTLAINKEEGVFSPSFFLLYISNCLDNVCLKLFRFCIFSTLFTFYSFLALCEINFNLATPLYNTSHQICSCLFLYITSKVIQG